jgi:hypothetical protein
MDRVTFVGPLLLLMALSCSTLDSPRPSYSDASTLLPSGKDAKAVFLKELKAWTRHDKIYQGLDNKLFISATYHAPDFRRAFAIAFPDIYGHGGKVTGRELVDLTGGIEQHHNFFVATYTPNVRWNDFARDDSIWRISLYSTAQGSEGVGQAEVAPDEIIPLKVDENLRAVYPYISRFDKIYLVRFPLKDAWDRPIVDSHSSQMVMRVASALGVATLRWPAHPPSDAPAPAAEGGVAH